MASQPIYTQTLWDPAGKPYWATTDGGRMYIPPIVAAQYHHDPKMVAWAQSQGAHIGTNGEPTVTGAPEGGGLHTNGTWNDQTGQYDQSLDWGNILAGVNAGAIAAPFVAGALGAGGATAGGTGSTAASSAGYLAPEELSIASSPITGSVSTLAGAAGGASSGGGILGTLGSLAKNPVMGKVGNILTQGAQGLAAGRREDNAANTGAAAINNRSQFDAATFNRDLPLTQAQQTARGDLMSANLQPSMRSGSGRDVSFSGGVGPQDFSQTTTDAGNELKRQALADLMSGKKQLTPQMASPSKAGAGENIMAGIGMGTNILGAFGRWF